MRRGTAAVAKVTITISNVSWRGGRPRYQPGPKHRKLGLKGQDLKRLDGSWMSAEEAAALTSAMRGRSCASTQAAASSADIHEPSNRLRSCPLRPSLRCFGPGW